MRKLRAHVHGQDEGGAAEGAEVALQVRLLLHRLRGGLAHHEGHEGQGKLVFRGAPSMFYMKQNRNLVLILIAFTLQLSEDPEDDRLTRFPRLRCPQCAANLPAPPLPPAGTTAGRGTHLVEHSVNVVGRGVQKDPTPNQTKKYLRKTNKDPRCFLHENIFVTHVRVVG